MNNRWKKILSLFLALSIVCSLVVVPAAAAGEALTLSTENGAWSGKQYKVDVVAKGTGSFNVAVAAITVEFEKELLTFVGAEDKTGFSMVQAPNVSKANEEGSFNLGPTDGDGGKTFTSSMAIATLTFQLKDDVENQDTELYFKDVDIQDSENQAYAVTSVAGVVSITNGVAPTVDTVGLDKTSVTVDGTDGDTVTATAKSKAGTNISSTVAWTVSPADAGVTVDKGTVTVSATAKAGEYTISAGGKSAVLTVTRAAAAAKEIVISENTTEISGDDFTLIKPTAGETNTYTFTAKILDQYGDVFTGDVTWNAGTQVTGVTVASNVITVADSAVVDSTFDFTATYGTISKTLRLTVKAIDITWPTATVKADAVYGDTWSQIVTLSGGSAELNGEKVKGTFSVKNGDDHPNAGTQSYVVNFKSADGQYDVDSDEKTATIAKLPITLQMDDHKVAYGDTFQYYEFDQIFTGKPVLFSDRVEVHASGDAAEDGSAAVGTYKIHGTAEHQNYAITVKDGTLTIEKKGVDPTETVPELTIVGKITTGTDETGRATITGTIEASAKEARSLEALLEAVAKLNPGMVPNQTTFTITIGENSATFTFKRWALAPGQEYDGPGTYEIVPVWDCSDNDIAKNYEPNLPKLFVEVEGKTETLTVNDGKTWSLYVSDLTNAKSLEGLLPSYAYYSDGTSVKIQGWKYSDGTTVTLANLKKRAESGSSVTLYPVVSPSYLEVDSLRVRFVSSSSSGSTGTTNNSGTGSNLSFTLDPNKLFLNSLPKDVPSTYWAANSIGWAYARGVMGGMSDGNFHPEGLTNRQQLWMVLDRLSGGKPANMAEARAWSITAGISDGSNPGSSLTRQQLVTMLYRYAQLKGYATTGGTSLSTYADAGRVSSYAQAAMSWAVGNGIVGGTADGRLNPQGTATRAHFATFLYRFCVKYGA